MPASVCRAGINLFTLGQSKKNSVSGEAAGCLKEGRVGTFFHFCKLDNVFLPT